MKRLYIKIEKKYRDAELERLLEELRTEGIEVCQLSGTQLEEQGRASVPGGSRPAENLSKLPGNGEEALILTDSQVTADRLPRRESPAWGMSRPGQR